MASIECTAYPRQRSRLDDDERNARYTLSGEERDFVRLIFPHEILAKTS